MLYDSETLLSYDLVRGKLSADELELAREDEDWLPNKILEQMTTVLTVSIEETTMPGSASASWVNEWRGLFFVRSDAGPEGPFATLEEAMNVDLFTGFLGGTALDSDRIGEEELVAYAASRFMGGTGETVWINSDTYEYNGTGFDLIPYEPDPRTCS